MEIIKDIIKTEEKEEFKADNTKGIVTETKSDENKNDDFVIENFMGKVNFYRKELYRNPKSRFYREEL